MGARNTSVGLAVCAAMILGYTSSAFAQKAKKPETTQILNVKPVKGDDKVDITDLEKKYWAPKDTDFSVVQNRTYSKVNKFTLTPQWGRLINDPYSEGNLFGLTANYFWSERMGVQLMYMHADLHNSNSVDDIAVIASSTGAVPDHGKITGFYGVGYNLIPFYAKMSVWGQKIIYFDMAFSPFLGMTEYDQQMASGNRSKSALTYGIDITQYFFISRWFAVRADLRNQWRNEEIVKYRTYSGVNEGTKLRDRIQQDTMFLIGGMFYF